MYVCIVGQRPNYTNKLLYCIVLYRYAGHVLNLGQVSVFNQLLPMVQGLSPFEFIFVTLLVPGQGARDENSFGERSFGKHCGKGENAGNQHFLLFPRCFLLCQR